MKNQQYPNLITLIISILAIISTPGFSQKNNISFTIETTPGVIFSYERILIGKSSLAIGLTRHNREIKGKKNGSGSFATREKPTYEKNGTGLQLEYRYYFSNQGKAKGGFYAGINTLTEKQHLLHRKVVRYEDIPLIATLLSFGLAGDTKPIYAKGRKTIYVTKGGVKLGYQKRWDILSLDLGLQYHANYVHGKNDFVLLDNGSIQEYRSDVTDSKFSLYVGMGASF